MKLNKKENSRETKNMILKKLKICIKYIKKPRKTASKVKTTKGKEKKTEVI